MSGGLWVKGNPITEDRSNWKSVYSADATPASAFAGQVWSNTSYSPSTIQVYGSDSKWYPETILRQVGSAIAAQSNTYPGMFAYCIGSGSGFWLDKSYQRASTGIWVERPSIKRAAGSVSVTTEDDIVSVTPDTLPCVAISTVYVPVLSGGAFGSFKLTDNNNAIIGSGSVFPSIVDAASLPYINASVNTTLYSLSTNQGCVATILAIISSSTVTPIKVRAGSSGARTVKAELVVLS